MFAFKRQKPTKPSLPATPVLQDDEDDVVYVNRRRVSCDGGGGALGHPITWLDMGQEDHVICKYCDRVFKLDPNAVADESH